MHSHNEGCGVILVCNECIGSALRHACEHDSDNDAIHLARAANIVRREMLKIKNRFSCSFDIKCQDSVPVSM